MSWLGDFNLNTCYYAEVDNNGPIADMSNHINWRGVKNITYQHTLQKYTVESFIHGQHWLPQLDMPFILELLRSMVIHAI